MERTNENMYQEIAASFNECEWYENELIPLDKCRDNTRTQIWLRTGETKNKKTLARSHRRFCLAEFKMFVLFHSPSFFFASLPFNCIIREDLTNSLIYFLLNRSRCYLRIYFSPHRVFSSIRSPVRFILSLIFQNKLSGVAETLVFSVPNHLLVIAGVLVSVHHGTAA